MSYADDIKRLRRRCRRAHRHIKSDAKSIRRHGNHHGIKKALIRMCVKEDALTFGAGVLRTSSERIVDALAVVIAKKKR